MFYTTLYSPLLAEQQLAARIELCFFVIYMNHPRSLVHSPSLFGGRTKITRQRGN